MSRWKSVERPLGTCWCWWCVHRIFWAGRSGEKDAKPSRASTSSLDRPPSPRTPQEWLGGPPVDSRAVYHQYTRPAILQSAQSQWCRPLKSRPPFPSSLPALQDAGGAREASHPLVPHSASSPPPPPASSALSSLPHPHSTQQLPSTTSRFYRLDSLERERHLSDDGVGMVGVQRRRALNGDGEGCCSSSTRQRGSFDGVCAMGRAAFKQQRRLEVELMVRGPCPSTPLPSTPCSSPFAPSVQREALHFLSCWTPVRASFLCLPRVR